MFTSVVLYAALCLNAGPYVAAPSYHTCPPVAVASLKKVYTVPYSTSYSHKPVFAFVRKHGLVVKSIVLQPVTLPTYGNVQAVVYQCEGNVAVVQYVPVTVGYDYLTTVQTTYFRTFRHHHHHHKPVKIFISQDNRHHHHKHKHRK